MFNADSDLYFDFFSVFASGFIVTFALMLQPHILTKVLYLQSEKDIGRFITTTVLVAGLFTCMLFIGFYAALAGLEIRFQDAVVREYLLHQFAGSSLGPYALTFIFMALLAAGMSTLDGILVALSAMVVNDIIVPMTGNHRLGLKASRVVLVGIGIVGLWLAWDPPPLVGLFAQKGVYGLAAASLVPIFFGVLIKNALPAWVIATAAMLGLFLHLIFNFIGGVTNPAVSASYGILVSALYAAVCLLVVRMLAGRG